MSERRPYVKRERQLVVAVQLALETPGFTYEKWGATQHCKAGDWVVSNDGETYTVDRESFSRTYRPAGAGTYIKVTPVWAIPAESAGEIRTKEGITHYKVGDYLVSNEEDGRDGYAVAKDDFERMYEPAG